jgi:redox-sensitive bicupin YhaK (pirin superfamily)
MDGGGGSVRRGGTPRIVNAGLTVWLTTPGSSRAVLTPGKAATIRALGEAMVMALGGEPVGPRYIDWNFVSSSKDRINQAREDWKAGRMKLPDLDNGEFIPLPPKLGEMFEPESAS